MFHSARLGQLFKENPVLKLKRIAAIFKCNFFSYTRKANIGFFRIFFLSIEHQVFWKCPRITIIREWATQWGQYIYSILLERNFYI
jgi:hypothetical protein